MRALGSRASMRYLRRSDLLLAVGMVAGAGIAGVGLVGDSPVMRRAVPDDAVAVVGGEPISRASFATAIGLVERDRGDSLTGEERRRILERLIDEELLLQRGLALGLPRSDRKLRSDLVAAVVDAATSAADDVDPTPAELRAFFEQNRGLFEGPPDLRVAQVFVAAPPRTDEEARGRAREAVKRLRAGADLVAVRRELGDPPAVEIPASRQPASKLRDYIGSAAASVAQALRTAEISEPQRGPDGYRVLVMLERGEESSSTFDDSRARVLAELRRRAGERAIRDYLDKLRATTEVMLAEPLAEAAP